MSVRVCLAPRPHPLRGGSGGGGTHSLAGSDLGSAISAHWTKWDVARHVERQRNATAQGPHRRLTGGRVEPCQVCHAPSGAFASHQQISHHILRSLGVPATTPGHPHGTRHVKRRP